MLFSETYQRETVTALDSFQPSLSSSRQLSTAKRFFSEAAVNVNMQETLSKSMQRGFKVNLL